MNNVILIGRLTRDPDVRYTSDTQLAVASFTLAIDRPMKKDGSKATDYPRVKVFGKAAENVERYVSKGSMVAIQGSIQTGSYKNKNGDTVYTTDVLANRVKFLEPRAHGEAKQEANEMPPESFQAIDEDVPF